ncbi:glycosyltransferase family 4 protein [Bradyrhizobium sp. McL0615]|uniref:glycosyltransferase family 4 protein n=1 Tax=Bradyrhizobium sp. McL0615 TaxID=3415673 RepID=UPI003CE7ACC9
MKILLATPLYSPLVSGSARLLQDIVEHLLASGHHVEVVTLDLPQFGDSKEFDDAQTYRIHRIRSPRFEVKGWSSIVMTIRMLTLCALRKFDIVLCGFASPTAILARAICSVTRVPYAVYTHGEDLIAARAAQRRSALSSALQAARVVMCNSSFTASEAAWFGVPRDRILTISPGIDPAPYLAVSTEEVDALRTRFNLVGKKILLTLARLQVRKGHDMVVRALPTIAASVPDVHYLIVGKGDTARLEAIASDLGVYDRLTVIDYVPTESLPALFALCDVYVMASRYDPETREVEGFGIVYLEAAACGKPSVAGNQGGCADAVVDQQTGIVVDPTDVLAIERAVIRLLSNEEESRRMGIAGRERICREFRKSDQLSRIEDALLRCVGKGHRPGHVERVAGERSADATRLHSDETKM